MTGSLSAMPSVCSMGKTHAMDSTSVKQDVIFICKVKATFWNEFLNFHGTEHYRPSHKLSHFHGSYYPISMDHIIPFPWTWILIKSQVLRG